MADELQSKQPKLAPQGMATEKGLSGGKVQPGSPNKLDLAAAGINKGKLESQKHADKRMNALFKKTGQPTLGQWNYEKRNNPMAEPDKVKFNPTFDKTQQINERLAQKPLGKPDPEFEQMNEQQQRAKASELFKMDLTKKPYEGYEEGFETGNFEDENLRTFLRGLGHDDATARILVSKYKNGGTFAGLDRWQIDKIAKGGKQ